MVDRAARPFEDVVAEHGPVVMRVCCAIVGPIDAEDAWSETFLSALRAYPDLESDSNVRGWLVTIAHNKAIDALRSQQRRAIPVADVPEAGATERPAALDDELRERLNTLPPKQRSAVVYRHLADMSYADIATALDTSEAAVRRNVADGLAKLRQTHERGQP